MQCCMRSSSASFIASFHSYRMFSGRTVAVLLKSRSHSLCWIENCIVKFEQFLPCFTDVSMVFSPVIMLGQRTNTQDNAHETYSLFLLSSTPTIHGWSKPTIIQFLRNCGGHTDFHICMLYCKQLKHPKTELYFCATFMGEKCSTCFMLNFFKLETFELRDKLQLSLSILFS